MSQIAIRSVGVALPDEIRTNDHWEPALTRAWMEGRRRAAERPIPPAPTEGVAKVRQAMADANEDPFCGGIQRYHHPKDQPPSALEARACRDALDRAGIDASEIDFILEYTTTPDFLVHPNAPILHRELGLRRDCLALSNDGVCNAFHLQLHLADQLLRGGRYRRGLLVQGCFFTWVHPHEVPFATWNGDAATAVVVELSETHGLLADAHRTVSSLACGVVVGQPGEHWTNPGANLAYLEDKEASRLMLEGVADMGAEVVHAALSEAGLGVDDVDFYASHQASVWFRRVTQEVIGLHRAKSVDTYPWAGSVGAANIPLVLATGEREGLLRPGDIVAAYSGGSGVTVSGSVLRWGI